MFHFHLHNFFGTSEESRKMFVRSSGDKRWWRGFINPNDID